MFGITYETWTSICDMYFSLKNSTLKSYLQWFPFTKLTNSDKDTLKSLEFFQRYIETGAFVLFSPVMHQSENFMQKSDGSFRDSSLIAPLPYLMLQAVGKEIHDHYCAQRPSEIAVYYAGNYQYKRPKYKQDYDCFFKEINACIGEYQYFIKTDISNFFANISIDKLIAQIDVGCNTSEIHFPQTKLLLIKELLKYCGNGKFPLIENSIASSFLSTIVYLDEVDTKLNQYITEHIPAFSSFRIIRYVDDMYILFSSPQPKGALRKEYNEIRNEYSSLLKKYGLALNAKKCCFKMISEINQELKKSLYDEQFNGEKHHIEEQFSGSLKSFLSDLSIELLLDSVDVEGYNELIEKHFSSPDIEFTPNEVFNYFVYENNDELQTESVTKEIIDLVKQSVSFINLDPKRLTIMVMKTQNDEAIRSFLNQLFKRNRANKWNCYDTTIAISYLIQSKFRHIDLLNILSQEHPQLYSYYFYNCKNSFVNCLTATNINKLIDIIANDSKVYYLFFMYLCEKKREDYMAAFAYCKNFFDRVTAHFAFTFEGIARKHKPAYRSFYHEDDLIAFYSNINGSEAIIKQAHKLRNTNPLSHSSSELLDRDNTTRDLKQTIKNLFSIIEEYTKSKK